MPLTLLLLSTWLLVPLAALGERYLGSRTGVLLAAPLLALAGWAAVIGFGSAPQTPAGGLALSWIPQLDVSLALRLDGLALLFLLVVLVIGAVVMAFSAGYFTGQQTGSYYPLMVGFAAAMSTLVMTDDLVVLFVAWELTTICSYLLILRSGPQAKNPAARTLLVTVAGGLALLAAVALIIAGTGTTSLHEALQSPVWSEDSTFAAVVAGLIILAAATKAAQFPFHFWLPDAMVAPAPVSAYLHAAAMVKAGIFLLLRFAEPASQSSIWTPTLVTIGMISLLAGAVFALQCTDLKELLAYSTISQLGLMVVVIGVGGPAGVVAAAVHVVAHAVFKAGGFMYVGYLDRVAGTRDVRELRGLWATRPLASVAGVALALAMAGVPLTVGFVSKEAILAAVDAGGGILLALGVGAAAALTVAYSARFVPVAWSRRGPATRVQGTGAGERTMVTPVVLSAITVLALGLLPGLIDGLIGRVALALGVEEAVHLTLWHGFTTALVLSVAALALGAILASQIEATQRVARRVVLPWRGVDVVDGWQQRIITAGSQVGAVGNGARPAVYLAVPAGLIAIGGGVALGAWWPAGVSLPALAPAGYGAIDAGLLLLVAIGAACAVAARTTIALILSSGIAGLGVGLWFFTLGASDVALTQLLVEILTVVVMMVVIRHLPRRLPTMSRMRAAPAAVIAVGAGLAATVAVLGLTGRTDLSWAAEWYLQNATAETGGENVVNTILVDFRAFDTLGELVVLALAALSITALLDARPRIWREPRRTQAPLADPDRNAVILRVAARVLVPVMILGSVYALVRGHNAPGGGFIAALLGAAALAVRYLAASTDDAARMRWPAIPIAGAGVLIAVLTGLVGFVDGSFLRPLHADVFGVHLTTALVFDVGVYLAVFGVILGALNRLGTPPSTAAGPRDPAPEDPPPQPGSAGAADLQGVAR